MIIFARPIVSNYANFRTKIDFEFSCEKSLCSINAFEKLREISLFICSSRTFHVFSGQKFAKLSVEALRWMLTVDMKEENA